MNLHIKARGETGKEVTKSANDSIEIDIYAGTVKREHVGSLWIDYRNDRKDGCDTDEWIASWKDNDMDDPVIIAQGNI